MTIIYAIIILVIISLFIPFVIIWRKKSYKPTLNDDEHKFWDILIKATSSLLTIGTLIISAITYLNNQAESIKQKEIEHKKEIADKERDYRKEIATKQVEFYTDVSSSIAEYLVIANYPDSFNTPPYYIAKDSYEKLYYGRLNLIESAEVDKSLHNFNMVVEQFECGDEDTDIHTLRLAAFDVNNACRESIRKTWGVDLDTLNRDTK